MFFHATVGSHTVSNTELPNFDLRLKTQYDEDFRFSKATLLVCIYQVGHHCGLEHDCNVSTIRNRVTVREATFV